MTLVAYGHIVVSGSEGCEDLSSVCLLGQQLLLQAYGSGFHQETDGTFKLGNLG